jgi:hypothetical protein
MLTNKANVPTLIILFSFLLLVSCNVQDVERYNPDFQGNWRTNVFYSPSAGDSIRNYIIIDGKDSALGIACDKNVQLGSCLIFQSGKVKINKSTMFLQIGNSIQNTRRVDVEPYLINNSEWEMVLDSLVYSKF